MGASLLWQRRTRPAAAATLAATVVITSLWANDLLGRSPSWHPWLRTAVVIAGLAAAVGLPAAALPRTFPLARVGARLGVVAGVVGVAAGLGGPVAYTLDTVGTGHSGSIVTAGPAVASGRGFPGAGGGRGRMFGGGTPPAGAGRGQNGFPGFPGFTGGGTAPQFGGGMPGGGQTGGQAGGQAGGRAGGQGGGMGGLLNGAQVSSAMKSALLADADEYTWVAAAIGSQNQASYQLATGKPVMSIGGFNGSDPSPTLAQFQKDVSDGRIHYFIGGGGMGGGGGGLGGSGTASRITTWAEANFTAKTFGTTTVYDLTAPRSPSTTTN